MGSVREHFDSVTTISSRRRWATPSEDLVTTILMAVMTTGLFLDGWSHNNNPTAESFLSPSHYLLYASFSVTTIWILWITFHSHPGRTVAAVPVGYGLGLVGIGVFILGGIGDAIWHATFTFEVSIDALLSPTHVLLFVGGLLIGTSPLRSAWHRPDPDPMTLTVMTTPVVAMALAAASVGFFFQYVSGFNTTAPAVEYLPVKNVVDPQAALGIAGIMLTNLILLGALLLLIRRWTLPFGAATIVIGVHAATIQVLREFPVAEIIIGAVVAGLAADLLIGRLRPSLSRIFALRVTAAAIPVLIWGSFFVFFETGDRILWPPELWSGAIVFASAAGLGLSLVLVWPSSQAALIEPEPNDALMVQAEGPP